MRCSTACRPTSTVASRSACSGRSRTWIGAGARSAVRCRSAEIAAIADAHQDSVIRVVEAFRAPECCFLMPPAGEPLDEATLIDISHESLLRGWDRMTGEGWLVQEDRDGKVYRSLVDAAETFEKDPTAVLPRALTRQRETWWKKTAPNAAWAERYGDRFELVSDLAAAERTASAHRALGRASRPSPRCCSC